jgi:sulfonate transport system permease protein
MTLSSYVLDREPPRSPQRIERPIDESSVLAQLSVGRFLGRALGRLAAGALLPIMVIGAWSQAVRFQWVAPQILPAPSLVWTTGLSLLESGELVHQLGVSLERLAIGLLFGGVLGLACGLTLGMSRTLDDYFGPTVRALFLVPALGWLPFFMLIFGIGEELKIVLIAKTCFFPLMVNVFYAVRSIPSRYDDLALAMELDAKARLRFIVLPAIVPAITTGLRQALSKGWKVLILVEMISSAAGIGYLMMWGRKSFQLDVVFAAMVVVGLVGLVFDRGVLRIQSKIANWSLHTGA